MRCDGFCLAERWIEMALQVSVLITTCNRAEHLRRCLAGYLRQTEGDFEVVISDDGSTDHTAEVVEDFTRQAPFPVHYVWYPHDGHRRAEVINRAIAASHHEWLLFSDCDAVPLPDLVAVHRRYADPQRLLCGERILLDQATTESITCDMVLQGLVDRQLTLPRRVSLWTQHIKNRIYIMVRRNRRPHNLGLNMSCSRAAMEAINGYDHNFRGWGNADGDVRDRMRMLGIEPKSVVHKAVIFHLWHPRHDTMRMRANLSYARRGKIPARCETGLDAVRL